MIFLIHFGQQFVSSGVSAVDDSFLCCKAWLKVVLKDDGTRIPWPDVKTVWFGLQAVELSLGVDPSDIWDFD